MRPHSPSAVPRQLLKQEVGLPGIACNVGRPSSNRLYQFHRLMVPSNPYINGHRNEHMSVGYLAVLGVLVGRCVIGCCSCLSGCVLRIVIVMIVASYVVRRRRFACPESAQSC